MKTYEELIERYDEIVDKLFSNEEITDSEAEMLGRFFGGGGTFPEIPDEDRENMMKLKGNSAREDFKEMIKRTIARSGKIRRNLEGWEWE